MSRSTRAYVTQSGVANIILNIFTMASTRLCNTILVMGKTIGHWIFTWVINKKADGTYATRKLSKWCDWQAEVIRSYVHTTSPDK